MGLITACGGSGDPYIGFARLSGEVYRPSVESESGVETVPNAQVSVRDFPSTILRPARTLPAGQTDSFGSYSAEVESQPIVFVEVSKSMSEGELNLCAMIKPNGENVSKDITIQSTIACRAALIAIDASVLAPDDFNDDRIFRYNQGSEQYLFLDSVDVFDQERINTAAQLVNQATSNGLIFPVFSSPLGTPLAWTHRSRLVLHYRRICLS